MTATNAEIPKWIEELKKIVEEVEKEANKK